VRDTSINNYTVQERSKKSNGKKRDYTQLVEFFPLPRNISHVAFSKTSMTALNLDEVRRIARNEGCALISYSKESSVISFRKGASFKVRINIFWTTSTVGTCLDHPRQCKTQLFRRNVDLSTLREIFKNPRVHTGTSYYTRDSASKHIFDVKPTYESEFPIGSRVHVKGFADATVASTVQTYGCFKGRIKVHYSDGEAYHVYPKFLKKIISDDNECQDLENEAKVQLNRLKKELKEIQDEMAKVLEIVNTFEQEREQEQKRLAEAAERKAKAEDDNLIDHLAKRWKEEADLLEYKRRRRGKYIYGPMCHADRVSEFFDQKVISMACGGSATVLLYENGSSVWTEGLSNDLLNELNGRQRNLPLPVYVAMGSQDRYYIRFSDDSSQFFGCDELSKELKKISNIRVQTVAFGEKWDSYVVVYADGGLSYSNVPSGLSDLIENTLNEPELECVSLGPSGEYFVSTQDGRMMWGGMTTENADIANRNKDEIKFMDFGDFNTFFVRHS